MLGFELDHALALLRDQGYTVEVQEVRSKKGLHGNESRVVRQQNRVRDGQTTVCLTYAIFQTLLP